LAPTYFWIYICEGEFLNNIFKNLDETENSVAHVYESRLNLKMFQISVWKEIFLNSYICQKFHMATLTNLTHYWQKKLFIEIKDKTCLANQEIIRPIFNINAIKFNHIGRFNLGLGMNWKLVSVWSQSRNEKIVILVLVSL